MVEVDNTWNKSPIEFDTTVFKKYLNIKIFQGIKDIIILILAFELLSLLLCS